MMPIAGKDDLLVETFPIDVRMDQWGCPYCAQGKQPQVTRPTFPSQAMEQLQMDKEINEFLKEADRIYFETGMPPYPIMCFTLCLLLTPMCMGAQLNKKRATMFEKLFKEWNEKHGVPKGVVMQWNQDFHTMGRIEVANKQVARDDGRPRQVIVPTTNMNPGAELRVNPMAHKAYCERVGRPFPPAIAALAEENGIALVVAVVQEKPVEEQPRSYAPPSYDQSARDQKKY